jgi:hypothetical protein
MTRLRKLHIPLHKDQQTLVPQDGQLVFAIFAPARVGESNVVEDERVDDLVRKRVLFVKQYTNEQ